MRRSALGFALVGVLSTLTHVCVATLLIEWLGARAPLANGVAFVVATLLSYVANTRWSFGARLGMATAGRFALVAGTAGLMSMGIAWLVERAGGHYALGIALVVVFVPAFSFVGHRSFTYR
ncbi:GtrA family protein [Acidovorax sp. Root219]|uniref:GtrA family protein n=1 Tax=Acidovorax sp. Root219 TaxID=1736493 RepID=UPI00070C0FA1|nr:GtrA family protein [Acidovorax sp. Root219]